NGVKKFRVDVFAHQLFLVDQQEHENQDERKHQPVYHLGNEHDEDEMGFRQENQKSPDDDQAGVKPIKLRRFAEVLIHAGLPTESLTYIVGGRQGEDRGGKQRSVG